MTFPEELYWENIPDHMFTAFESRCALVELLLDDEVPRSEKRREKEEYMRTWKVGDRTIRRYCHVYRKKGPGALLFYTKREKAKRIDDPALAAKITELIQERPDRSVPKLRRLLSQNPGLLPIPPIFRTRATSRFHFSSSSLSSAALRSL
jgi:hypothetical protein